MMITALILMLASGAEMSGAASPMPREDAVAMCKAATASAVECKALVSSSGLEITDPAEIKRIIAESRGDGKPYRRNPPRPPAGVLRQARSGDFACVVMAFDINENGRIENVTVKESGTTMAGRSSPLAKFEKAAAAKVAHWRYRPIMKGEERYRCIGKTTAVTFYF